MSLLIVFSWVLLGVDVYNSTRFPLVAIRIAFENKGKEGKTKNNS